MALVTRWKTPGGPTSAAAVCGSAWASDTTTPSRASLMALATFSGVMRFVVPLDSCPNGAHLPQVLNSVRHFSYWARSTAVSDGATGACAAGAALPCVRSSSPPTKPATARPAHTAANVRRFPMRFSNQFAIVILGTSNSPQLAASAACRRRRRRIHHRQEIGLFAHDLAQAAPGADFIIPIRTPRRAADTDSADQLIAVDNNRQSASLREIAERPLPQFGYSSSRHGVRGSPTRLARIERGLGLEECGRDSLLALAIHAIEINLLAELVENGDAHSHAFLLGFGHAGLRDLLGRGDVEHVLFEGRLCRIASDEKLVA